MTIKQRLALGLLAKGFVVCDKRSTSKLVAYTKPSFYNADGQLYIFLGIRGAFRAGRIATQSRDVSGSHLHKACLA